MDREDGFTLLELLISLTILSVIVATVFSGFRLGVRAWEKGEQGLLERQRYRIVLSLLKRQIASIRVQPNAALGGRILALRGDDKTMVFISGVALVPDNRFGNVYVQYQVEKPVSGVSEESGERFLLFEKSMPILPSKLIAGMKLAGVPAVLKDKSDLHALIPSVDWMEFAYLKDYSADQYVWQKTWAPDQDGNFPRAVRIGLKPAGSAEPLFLIVRLDAQTDIEKVQQPLMMQ